MRGGYNELSSVYCVDGKLLTSARIESGKSLDDAVKDIGCNRGTLSRWEREIARPDERSILRLILAYKRFDFVKKVGGGKE
jgi:transcriptional regulator with XRE-family HTH domain